MKYFKKFKIIVKPYLIVLTILFLPFILKNVSKHLHKDKEEQLDSTIFEKDQKVLIFLRKLETLDEDYYSDTNKICRRASDGVKYYLETGDTKFVDLYDFESRTNPKGRIKDLMEAFSENKSSKFRNYYWDITIFVLLFVLTLLSAIGFITCVVCCCLNCRCCDFCINKSYLLPCFVICTIMNLIIIICCIIGLYKTRSNFRGAASGECAILHFINEGIDGETKQSYPRWLGINGTIDMLNKTYSQLNDTSFKIEDINSLKDNYKKISLISEIQQKYKKNDLSSSYLNSDIENLFNNIHKNMEKLTISSEQTLIIRAITYILTLSDNLYDLKRFAGENIADEGNYIHKTGKGLAYAFLCLFLIISIILQLLLIVYVFYAYGNSCVKISIHIFWFIMALFMIASFVLAMYCSLLCKLGPDVVKMFTYVIGEQNLNSSSPIILNDTEILNVCINGDGNLGKYLELESIYNSYENLRDYKTQIDYILKELEFKQDEIISKLNKALDQCNINDRYSFTCKQEFPDFKEESCDSLSKNKCINPLTCYNNELSIKYQNSSCSQVIEFANEVNNILFSYDFTVNDSTINSKFNKNNNNTESYKYKFKEAKSILENYSYILEPVMEKIELDLENGTALEYLDCSFLGKHLRTGFHYLHDSVNHQFAGFSVLFFIIGVAMAFSVIFTIILLMIINKMMAFTKQAQPKKVEEPKPLDTSKTQMSDKDLAQNNPSPTYNNFNSPPYQEPVIEEKSEPPKEDNFSEPQVEDVYEESKEEKNEVPFPMNTTTHEENY